MVGKQMTPREEQIFNRTGLLLGSDAMRFLSQCRIIIFGVGGVGSWCAESLVRSGVGNITLVDSDTVSLSNINRQAMATMATVGQPKVSALAERLRSINPDCDITERCQTYSSDNAVSFNLEEYNCIIDAIDSLEHKLELILHATNVVRQQKEQLWKELGDDKRNTPVKPHSGFFSSMGSALKIDPTQVQVSEFWEVDGCPLAKMLRKRMRHQERYPATKFRCVWSPEVLPNRGASDFTPQPEEGDSWSQRKAQVNGTIAHITAIFGFTLASLAIRHLTEKKENKKKN